LDGKFINLRCAVNLEISSTINHIIIVEGFQIISWVKNRTFRVYLDITYFVEN